SRSSGFRPYRLGAPGAGVWRTWEFLELWLLRVRPPQKQSRCRAWESQGKARIRPIFAAALDARVRFRKSTAGKRTTPRRNRTLLLRVADDPVAVDAGHSELHVGERRALDVLLGSLPQEFAIGGFEGVELPHVLLVVRLVGGHQLLQVID